MEHVCEKKKPCHCLISSFIGAFFGVAIAVILFAHILEIKLEQNYKNCKEISNCKCIDCKCCSNCIH